MIDLLGDLGVDRSSVRFDAEGGWQATSSDN
jgi:hypothetical protein